MSVICKGGEGRERKGGMGRDLKGPTSKGGEREGKRRVGEGKGTGKEREGGKGRRKGREVERDLDPRKISWRRH